MTEYTTEPFFRVFVQFIPGYGPTGWVSTRRIVPMSFRSSLKGMGAAQFRILSFDETEDEEFSIRTEIREIAIVDNRNKDASGDFDNDLDKILWRGFVTSVTTDRYHQDPNSMGQIFAEEYGVGLYKIPITYEEETPNFNPYYDDIQFGNFITGNFRNSDFANRNGVGLPWGIIIDGERVELDESADESESADEYCWNRKKIIEKLVSDSSAVNEVVFPWEEGEAQLQEEFNEKVSEIKEKGYSQGQEDELIRLATNKLNQDKGKLEESYDWFFDHDIDEISNYEDQSLIDALIDLLPEPFDFYFDNNISSSAPELVIINKSAFDVPGMCPANLTIDINIPANDTAILNHNIRSEDVYDRVIVRGAPYLWCGSLTFWGDQYSDKPLIPDWTEEEETNWLLGTVGDLEGEAPTPEDQTITNIIRNVYDSVFQKFKFKDDVPIIGQRAGNYGSADDTGNFKADDYNYFFGQFYGIDLENGDQSKLITPFINVKQNRTPNKLATSWEAFLPFSRFSDKKRDVRAIQYSLERDRYAQPFLVSPHVRLEDPNQGTIYWVDRSRPFDVASSVEISYHENGIWIRRENPQTDLSQEDSLFKFMKDGSFKAWDLPVEDLADIDNLELNPVTNEDPTLEGWSNYQKWIITIAGRSKDRLQAFKWRKDSDGNQVPGSDSPKEKIIDVPAEVWLVHPNTVRNVAVRRIARIDNPFGEFSGTGESSRDNLGNDLIRFLPAEARNESFTGNPNGVTIVRDDRKLLLQYLEAYSALLLNPRAELNLSLAIDRKYPALSIGRLIGKAQDGEVVYDTNSAVASIEYIIETGAPRIMIQTSVPNEPLFTQSIHEAQEGKGERPPVRPNVKAPRLFPYRMRDGGAI